MSRTKDFLRSIFKIRPFEIILAKFTNGSSSRSFIGKCTPNNYSYEHGTYRTINRNGRTFKLDISQMVDWYFYFGFEEKEHQYLYRSLNADDVVFDVGANIGLVAIQLADKLQKGKVYAFEPFRKNFNRLKENLALNDIEHLKPYNLGFSEGEEEVSFFSPEAKNSGMVSVIPSTVGETHLTTLDTFIEENAIEKLSLIKLDVEGYEVKVLRGAKNTLDSFRPKLFVELNHRHLMRYGDSASSLVSLMENHGYRCTNCSNGQPLNSDMELDNLQTDIFAEPR